MEPENIKTEVISSIETVQSIGGSVNMDSSEFYDALEVLVKFAKNKIEEE